MPFIDQRIFPAPAKPLSQSLGRSRASLPDARTLERRAACQIQKKIEVGHFRK